MKGTIADDQLSGLSLISAPVAGNDSNEERDGDGEELSNGDDAQDSGTAFILIHHPVFARPAEHSIVLVCRVLTHATSAQMSTNMTTGKHCQTKTEDAAK